MSLATAADAPLIPPRARGPDRPLKGMALISAMRASMLSIWGSRAYELPIIASRLYGRDRVLVNDPAAVRRVLVENAAAYEKPTPTRRLTRPIIGEGVLLSEGAEWKRQRRALSPAFTPQHVERIAPHFADATRGLIAALEGRERVQLAVALQEAALDAAARSLFSLPIGGRGSRLAGLARSYIQGPGRPNVLDMIARRGWARRSATIWSISLSHRCRNRIRPGESQAKSPSRRAIISRTLGRPGPWM